MEGLEKYNGYLALLTAVLAVGGAFETFTNLGLTAKLFVVAIAALSVSLYCARIFASRVKPEPATPGFGVESEGPSVSGLVLSVLGLAAVLCLWIGLAVFVSTRFAAHFDETVRSAKSTAALTAAYVRIDKVTIQLPARSQSTCQWSDTSTVRGERLALQIIDFDSPVPKLQIENFYYPQALTIVCEPGAAVHPIVQPTSAAFYRSDDIGWLRQWIFIIGGAIWLIACGRFALLVRH
jgi:hypothetical protein